MPISLSSHMTSRVLDQWMPKGERGEGGTEGEGANEGREAHEGQLLALITESDRKSGGIYMNMG